MNIGLLFKRHFPNTFMLSNTFSDFFSEIRVTDHSIENKIENLRLQECTLKNRSFWYNYGQII